MLNVVVVDAQGGGMGAAIVKSLADKYGGRINIIAVGTNGIASAAMKKSGASCCATGENAVCFNVRSADVIIGGIGIIASCGMMGEITPAMARAIAESPAQKILIPISKCNILIPGVMSTGAKELIEMAVDSLADFL
ncbi:MAG: DUF3842 family protein [Burkholderiales bacterium]